MPTPKGTHFALCCTRPHTSPSTVFYDTPKAVENQFFDEAAFQIAIAPVVSEIVSAAAQDGNHEQKIDLRAANEHPNIDKEAQLSAQGTVLANGHQQNEDLQDPTEHRNSDEYAQLSAEAAALAKYLLRELDSRLEAMSTSISRLPESFKHHDADLSAQCLTPQKGNGLQQPPSDATHVIGFQTTENSDGKATSNPKTSFAPEVLCMEIAAPWPDNETTPHRESRDEIVHLRTATSENQKAKKRTRRTSIDMQNARTSSSGMFGIRPTDKNHQHLDQEDYKVTSFYYDSGWSQLVARSDTFANITLTAIFMNAVYLGYDADNNFEDNLMEADIQFRVCENLFCAFFFMEWLIRFCAFKNKFNCLKDNWFKFDSVLLAFMIVETWIFQVAGTPAGLVKLIRLLRLLRMTRLMRAFPELVAMIKGVRVASRAVGSALLMLVVLVYVFAIIMYTLLKRETNELVHERYSSLGITMWTLLIDGVFLDGIGILSRAMMDADQYVCVFLLLFFVLLSALTVMNMLIGVLCEVVSLVASAEKEDIAIRMVKDNLLNLLKELDEDGSGELSREELLEVLKHTDAMMVLENLNVDVAYLIDHLDMFFETEGALAIHQVLDMILMLRGDRPPTMKDLLHGQTFNRWKLNRNFEEKVAVIERQVTSNFSMAREREFGSKFSN